VKKTEGRKLHETVPLSLNLRQTSSRTLGSLEQLTKLSKGVGAMEQLTVTSMLTSLKENFDLEIDCDTSGDRCPQTRRKSAWTSLSLVVAMLNEQQINCRRRGIRVHKERSHINMMLLCNSGKKTTNHHV
jgi:hypothetical protein